MPPKPSTLGGSPVASPSDTASDKKTGEVVSPTLGASPDVIPKSTASPSPELAPKATGTTLVSLLKDNNPLSGLFSGDKSGSDTPTTTTSSSSSSSSNSHSASDEEVEEEEEDDVGVSNV